MTDIGTHEKSTCSVKTVVVSVKRDVTDRVDVSVLVIVSKGVQDNCLGRSCGTGVMGAFRAVIRALLSLVSGGVYESAHSVSSSSVAPSLFVTVMGGQLKPVASSGSDTSVIVRVVIEE